MYRFSVIFLLLLLLLPLGADAKMRIWGEELEPFTIDEVAAEDGALWYDAIYWLENFEGDLEWLAEDNRLTIRKGDDWSAINTRPPYVMRNGKPLTPHDPPRMIEGRLAVSDRFIRKVGPELLGIELKIASLDTRPLYEIVIDPAHGGGSAGESGGDGLAAKNLLMALSLELADRFEQEGYGVHLTRRRDVAMDPARRAAVANYWEADLFLTLDATGAARPEARGFEVFYPERPGAGNVELWENAQQGVWERSKLWADTLGNYVGDEVKTFNRGTRPLGSPVLEAVTCPAAMLIVGNISWPQEAELFRQGEARSNLVKAIVEAAEVFLRSSTDTPDTSNEGDLSEQSN